MRCVGSFSVGGRCSTLCIHGCCLYIIFCNLNILILHVTNQCCNIYINRWDRSGNESMTERYIRCASLAASLEPALSVYDLLVDLTLHISTDVHKDRISANLKSTQKALAFFGKVQVL